MSLRTAIGRVLIFISLILALSGFRILCGNLKTERDAGRSSAEALKSIEALQESQIENSEILLTAAAKPHEYALYELNPNIPMPQEQIGDWDYIGLLDVPSLGLRLPVISSWSYEALKSAPCRYSGSVYTDDLVICGHNYATHFSKLKTIEIGTEVLFIDLEGHEFRYDVDRIDIIPQDGGEELAFGEWDLSLFTCTKERVTRAVVRCVRKGA